MGETAMGRKREWRGGAWETSLGGSGRFIP